MTNNFLVKQYISDKKMKVRHNYLSEQFSDSKKIFSLDVNERIKLFFFPYSTPIIFGVYNTNFLKKIIKNSLNISTFTNFELALAIFTILLTNIEHVDHLYLVRQKPKVKGYQYSKNTDGYSLNTQINNQDLLNIIQEANKILINEKIKTSKIKKITNNINLFLNNYSKSNRKSKKNNINFFISFFKKLIIFLLKITGLIRLINHKNMKINIFFNKLKKIENDQLKFIKFITKK